MDVVIGGGHGQIALRLERLLAGRGDNVRGLVRNPDHFDDVSAAGAQPVLADLESDVELGPAVAGALVGALGAAGAVAADAVSFVVSVVSLAAIRAPDESPPPAARRCSRSSRARTSRRPTCGCSTS